MEIYKELNLMGVRCYTDAYITTQGVKSFAYYISLFGRPNTVKAIGAAIIESTVIDLEDGLIMRQPGFALRSFTQNFGGVCHKVLLCPDLFAGKRSRIIFGQDKDRAFEFLGSNTSTPLKREWQDWLWHRAFQTETLEGFGFDKEVCLLNIDVTDADLDALILEGLKNNEIN